MEGRNRGKPGAHGFDRGSQCLAAAGVRRQAFGRRLKDLVSDDQIFNTSNRAQCVGSLWGCVHLKALLVFEVKGDAFYWRIAKFEKCDFCWVADNRASRPVAEQVRAVVRVIEDKALEQAKVIPLREFRHSNLRACSRNHAARWAGVISLAVLSIGIGSGFGPRRSSASASAFSASVISRTCFIVPSSFRC